MRPNKVFGNLMRSYRDKIKIKLNGKKYSISREQVAKQFGVNHLLINAIEHYDFVLMGFTRKDVENYMNRIVPRRNLSFMFNLLGKCYRTNRNDNYRNNRNRKCRKRLMKRKV